MTAELKLQIIEFLGLFTGLVYLYYSYNEKIELWTWGFLSSIFAVLTYFNSQLYSEAILNGYYLIISVYGWYIWKFGVNHNHKKEPIIIRKIVKSEIFLLSVLFILIYVLVLVVLIKLPLLFKLKPASVPYFDAFCTTGSILGTWMLARKVLENWLVWVVVDIVSMSINYYRGLYFYTLLFLIYTIVALFGYHNWNKIYRNNLSNYENL